MGKQQFTELLAVLQEISTSLRVLAEHFDPEAFRQDEQETGLRPEVILLSQTMKIPPLDESLQSAESVAEIDLPK